MGASLVPAVFLDRDGVLVEDVDLLVRADQVRILPGVPEALQALKASGFLLVVVSNQAVVARGLATEEDVLLLERDIERRLEACGGVKPDAFFFCPHHPHATVPAYRVDCTCRKPRPGLLLKASVECGIDLVRSYMVGDRRTDVAAGARAGCRTILVETGKHAVASIETPDPPPAELRPDYVCSGLAPAAAWIRRDRP